MYIRKANFMICFTYLLFLVWTFSAYAQIDPDHQYQNRDNRYSEGIKLPPSSIYGIELISALVNYDEPVEQFPEEFKLQFYLPGPVEVFLTVRELDYNYYYWLDEIDQSWNPKNYNTFKWPTQYVIKPFGINIHELGALARLSNPDPGATEEVAPVILYHSQIPDVLEGEYMFTFKTSGNAAVICSIYDWKTEERVFTRTFPLKRGERPFTFRWNGSQAEEGYYRLEIGGQLLDSGDWFGKTVIFYHKPRKG